MDLEKLYNLEAGEFKNKLDGYNEQRQEDQFFQAYNAFKIAYHMKAKEGFSLEKFIDAYPWFDDAKKQNLQDQIEWRNEQRRLELNGSSN